MILNSFLRFSTIPWCKDFGSLASLSIYPIVKAFFPLGEMDWANIVVRYWGCDWQLGGGLHLREWLRWRHALLNLAIGIKWRKIKNRNEDEQEDKKNTWKWTSTNAHRQLPVVDSNLRGQLIFPQGQLSTVNALVRKWEEVTNKLLCFSWRSSQRTTDSNLLKMKSSSILFHLSLCRLISKMQKKTGLIHEERWSRL